jgi:anti-sigma factor RsiW
MNTTPSSPDNPNDPLAWESQRAALRQLHRDVLDEAIPPALLAAASQASQQHAKQARWMHWGGMAASVAIAFVAGWLFHAQTLTSGADVTLTQRSVSREFVHAASVAHAVYAPEKRHPVEVAATEQQHLVQWLSKRLNRPLKVPDLSTEGYALVGGRLLPGEDGARAQFMFENTAGERVTLYIGALDGLATAAGQPNPKETAFRDETGDRHLSRVVVGGPYTAPCAIRVFAFF